MGRAERIVASLLAHAGVAINGPEPWDIRVHDPALFPRVLRDKSLGLGEAYMEKWWDCDRLDEFFRRVCAADLDAWARKSLPLALGALLERVLNRQTRRKSTVVAKRHYDLGNDMFLSWLDPHNQYSCAYFDGVDGLEAPRSASSTSSAASSTRGPARPSWTSGAASAACPRTWPNTAAARSPG
jgi:cyclopropane-fatty-acyl-phospholipid synthase